MASSTLTYVGVSFFTFKEKINMDKMFNRGKYGIDGEIDIVNDNVSIGGKMFGVG